MSRFLILFFLLPAWHLMAQVEVAKDKFPFHEMVEWPNQGTLLMAKDPSNKTNDLYISFLNNQGENPWANTISPKSKEPKLITSEQSNYFYLIDQFKPQNNLITYHQINVSGSIVSTEFDVLKVIRNYRYTTPGDLELVEVVNTPKSIVFYFQMPVKSKGIIENFFVSITHHNNRMYYFKGPETDMKLKKKGEIGSILYAGADANLIHFAYYLKEGSKEKINFIGFNEKAEALPTSPSMILPKHEAIPSKIESKMLTGSHYLQHENDQAAKGKPIYLNKKYYYAINDAAEGCLKVFGQNKARKIVELNDCDQTEISARNPEGEIAYFLMDGKLFLYSKIEGGASAYIIDDNGVEKGSFTASELEKVQINPSSFKTKNKTANFVHIINGTAYFTSLENLENKAAINFKQ